MTGDNTLQLNVATVMAALQMYFDAAFADGYKVVVMGVSENRSDGHFVVHIKTPKSAGAA